MAQSRTPFPHLPSRSLPGDDSRRDTVIGVLDRVLARDDRPTPTTLVLVRGFDRASRSMVPTARRVAAASMLSFHDAVPAAAFGCVPEIDGMAVVLVANSALIPIAERYAAEWAGWVLALGDAVEEPVLRPAPAVLITAADGRRDHAVARLCVPGVAEPARDGRFDLAVEPHAHGLRVDRDRDGENVSTIEPSARFTVGRETLGNLDGVPQPFAAGEYTVVIEPIAFHRIVGAGQR